MSVIITVPATSANLGIGYDCLGMAVSLYSRFTFDRADELTITGCPEKYRNEDNLVYRSFVLALEHWGEKPFPIAIDIDTSIPSRGLGSSSTCTVAGIMGAAALTGAHRRASRGGEHSDQMEGHPDNVAPAIMGSLVCSFTPEGALPHCIRYDVNPHRSSSPSSRLTRSKPKAPENRRKKSPSPPPCGRWPHRGSHTRLENGDVEFIAAACETGCRSRIARRSSRLRGRPPHLPRRRCILCGFRGRGRP
ncbi:MAG: homoserine kinase [Slackia sp.]